MFTRTEIINSVIAKYKYASYLEIGVASPDANFNLINAIDKTSVDPRTDYQYTYNLSSDDFFKINQKKYDCIFLDGLHIKEQVISDIGNAIRFLNFGGTIICHDMNPEEEILQEVPQKTGSWCGDCWKAWMYYRKQANLNMFVVDTDYGVGIIQMTPGRPSLKIEQLINWSGLQANRKEWLNLISVEEFKEWLAN